ncbi:hypothetical protein [Albidovulum sediminis]|uniref:Uncharacterized protein n=1 Tax=Albidovulum sediminis TaxID=3066345 RepID=A0ABT2NRT1_9RHOB|nr:hypothetical protein [Defluviimonas sediminis]MCT8331657.1 hypothetical protein [Defluviimonas sediminis]
MTDQSVPSLAAYGQSFSSSGRTIAVFGLAFVFAAIGLMKFTAYEAEAI